MLPFPPGKLVFVDLRLVLIPAGTQAAAKGCQAYVHFLLELKDGTYPVTGNIFLRLTWKVITS